MRPLFSAPPPQPPLPAFLYGELLSGRPLAWVAASTPRPAQVRGRLWRLGSGGVVLEPDARGGWVDGELQDRPSQAQLVLLLSLLGGGGELAVALRRIHARVGPRSQPVLAPVAERQALLRAGAHPLRSGDWTRIAPG